MCTWVGYIGSGDAAEIMIEMLEKIEGLWSGYYTGMVTGENGKLQTGKVMGNIAEWKKHYSAKDFPGGYGLFHSRTNSGGGAEAAHPFISGSGMTALVSQGSYGIFADQKSDFIEAGNRLLDAGCHFSSASSVHYGKYPMLKDGKTEVHISDIVVEAVDYEYSRLHNPVQAIRNVASVLGEESATSFVFADQPGKIFTVNVSQRVVIGRGVDGMYCSVSSLAFPEYVGEIVQMPFNSIITLSENGYMAETLAPRFAKVYNPPKEAEDSFIDHIRKNPGTLLGHAVDKGISPLCPPAEPDVMYARAVMGYRVLEKLVADGMVKIKPIDNNSWGLWSV